MKDEKKVEEPKKPALSKEDIQIIINALSITQVQVKEAPRVIEIINKCQQLII